MGEGVCNLRAGKEIDVGPNRDTRPVARWRWPGHARGYAPVKLVTAVLAPERLDAVAAALGEAEVFRMTVTECRGVTRGPGGPELASKVRLEIAVNENFVKPTVDAITRAGQLSAEEASGFGKIFLTELLDVVRIRTGERGPDAI